MMIKRNTSRLLGALVLGVVAFVGCDELLKVENPAEIPITDLADPQLIEVLKNGSIGDFTDMYDDPFIWRGSFFTDEQITGINWEQTARLNQRIVSFDEGDPDFMFSELSESVRQSEDAATRIRALIDDPGQNTNLATVLAFAGYGYTAMGEAMCEAVVSLFDADGELQFGTSLETPAQIFQRALPHYQEAITIATAAGDADMLNLASVGLARAQLSLGNWQEVVDAVAAVPTDFQYWLEYSEASGSQNNILRSRVTGSNHSLGMHPSILQTAPGEVFGDQDLITGQTDPRIQHTTTWTLGHNRLTQLYKPYQGLRFGEYSGLIQANGDTDLPLYDRGTNILLADYNEAQHHRFEALGMLGGNDAAILTFVNDRRVANNQPTVTLSGAALMAELREQRKRDLFLGGFRLGDLRRWVDNGTGDFFPTGVHANTQWGNYENAQCFPLPIEELQGNPNLQGVQPTRPNG